MPTFPYKMRNATSKITQMLPHIITCDLQTGVLKHQVPNLFCNVYSSILFTKGTQDFYAQSSQSCNVVQCFYLTSVLGGY